MQHVTTSDVSLRIQAGPLGWNDPRESYSGDGIGTINSILGLDPFYFFLSWIGRDTERRVLEVSILEFRKE